jgi:hypothetical protein
MGPTIFFGSLRSPRLNFSNFYFKTGAPLMRAHDIDPSLISAYIALTVQKDKVLQQLSIKSPGSAFRDFHTN